MIVHRIATQDLRSEAFTSNFTPKWLIVPSSALVNHTVGRIVWVAKISVVNLGQVSEFFPSIKRTGFSRGAAIRNDRASNAPAKLSARVFSNSYG